MTWKLSQRDQDSDVDFKASILEQDVWMPVKTAQATEHRCDIILHALVKMGVWVTA